MGTSKRFEEDKNKFIQYNGTKMSKAFYNTAISVRDLKLWKAGMKPHRHWFVTDVKNYFGLTGRDKQGLVDQIEKIRDELINK